MTVGARQAFALRRMGLTRIGSRGKLPWFSGAALSNLGTAQVETSAL